MPMAIICQPSLKACKGKGLTNVFDECFHEHRLRIRAEVTRAEAGQCVSMALKRIRRAQVRKGMVLVNKTETPPRGQLLM